MLLTHNGLHQEHESAINSNRFAALVLIRHAAVMHNVR